MVPQKSADQPISKSEVAALDLSAERIWPAERVVDLGDWRVRIDRGVTRRANSILAFGGARGDQLNEAETLYHSSGLRPVFQITPATGVGALDELLKGQGYRQEGGAIVKRLSPQGLAEGEGFGDDFHTTSKLDPDWLRSYGQGQSDAEIKARAAILQRIRATMIFAAIGPKGAERAVGLGILDGRMGWINCMRTHSGYRRQGLGRRIVAGLCSNLRDLGASHIHLQVEVDNAPALTLYDAFGFKELYRYHYRVGAGVEAGKAKVL